MTGIFGGGGRGSKVPSYDSVAVGREAAAGLVLFDGPLVGSNPFVAGLGAFPSGVPSSYGTLTKVKGTLDLYTLPDPEGALESAWVAVVFGGFPGGQELGAVAEPGRLRDCVGVFIQSDLHARSYNAATGALACVYTTQDQIVLGNVVGIEMEVEVPAGATLASQCFVTIRVSGADGVLQPLIGLNRVHPNSVKAIWDVNCGIYPGGDAASVISNAWVKVVVV